MYSGGPSSTTFTGVYDSVEQEYVYPSARQNAVIAFSGFYLSAADGDFTTDGLSIMTQTGQSTDITIGNAPSAVLNATMLNPNGLMESLTWGDGAVYIGAQTASAAADTYASLPCHVYVNSIHYGINSSGNARRGSTTYTLGGTPLAVIANSTGTDVLFITDTKIGRYNGSFSVVTTPTAAQSFLAAKYSDPDEPIGIVLDANGCPAVFNNVAANTKITYSYVPMGIFDFSNVDAFGSTFTAEAYDKMTVFDADATDWINNLSFTGGKTIPQIIDALIATKFGMGYVIDANAVNTSSIVWSANPVTSYSVTYRQLIAWLAEAIGCNARMGRDGRVEFYVFNPTSVATFTPDIVVNGTRTKGKTPVPAITQVICYNALGAGYTSTGSAGSNYYIVANPFIDPSGSLTPINNIKGLVDDIPTYYATNISIACYDPHIDIGDFLTIEDREGGGTYDIPVMASTLHWAGMCSAELAATGNQVRAIPSSMENSDLASVVDSNPSAVVNKIQAVGISADWITTGKLTVLDSNNDVLFEADKDNETVQIGGFTVEDDKITAVGDYGETLSIVSGTYPQIQMTNGGSITSALRYGEIEMATPTNNLNIQASGAHFTNSSTGNGLVLYNYSPWIVAHDGSNNDETTIAPDALSIKNATTLTALGSGLQQTNIADASYTLLDSKKLSFNDGSTTTSVCAYHIRHNTGTTAEATYTIDLPPGIYLVMHGQYLAPNANAQGMQVLVIGTNSGSSSLVTTFTGSGSDLTATTGTRSQVTVGNSDGTSATLTWTVQGRGYRKLMLLRMF